MDAVKVVLVGCESVADLAGQIEATLRIATGAPIRIAARRADGAGPDADLVILITHRPKPSQIAGLLEGLRAPAGVPVWIAGEVSGAAETIALMEAGASDVIRPPVSAAELIPRIWRALRRSESEKSPVYRLKKSLGQKLFIGRSENFLAEARKLPKAAGCDATVLIAGETGTGKELFARAIHYLSARSDKPFTPVNCGAIPKDLVENELFGHERGAFTGAQSYQPGLVEQTEGGTLFLDEIDCLPPPSQVKLLRLLQEKEYRPVGSPRTRPADIRVVAATNADLPEILRSGQLRKDLFYRLNVFPFSLPRLRDRRADIVPLAEHFLTKYSAEHRRPVRTISAAALERLLAYAWPGNVRELENSISRAVILCEGEELLPEHFQPLGDESAAAPLKFRDAKARVVGDFEKSYLEELLAASFGNVSQAARSAGKNRRAFFELLRKHGVDARRFRRSADKWGEAAAG